MPSKSKKQAKFMRAVAHGWKPTRTKGPTQAVAREFVNADRRKKVNGYQFGGRPRGGVRGGLRGRGALSQVQPGGGGRPGGPGGRVPWRGAPPPRMMPGPGGGRGGRGGPGGNVPWRGAPPPRVQPGPQQDPRFQGRGGGALANIMRQFQQQGGRGGGGSSGGLRGWMDQIRNRQGQMMPPNKGPNRMVPPSMPPGYPGGGNPNLGGRNPMMRGARGRMGGGGRGQGRTSFY